MSGPGSVILVCVSMVLAVGAAIAAWESARYARQAREMRAEIERLRVQDGDAIDVIHEWQRNGEPNDYLTRVHRALRPPVSGDARRSRT